MVSRHGVARRLGAYKHRATSYAVNVLEYGKLRGDDSKHPADFSAYKSRLAGRLNPGFPEKWRVDPALQVAQPARIAVTVHCFYPELMPELYTAIANIPVPFDLLITNASGAELELPQVGSATQPNLRSVRVFPVENHGRDIFPLVQLVNFGALNPYELVLKVHTKKSAWRESHPDFQEKGSQWKDEFLSQLAGSTEQITEILEAFATDPSLGLVTANGNILGPKYWGGDYYLTSELLRRLELAPDKHHLKFAAGSMYWVRGFVLQGLRALNLIADDFDPEAGQVDGTTAHAIERLIGILAEEAGYHLSDVIGMQEKYFSANAKAAAKEISPIDVIARYQLDAPRTPRATVVPFYLPQFHPSPHNNTWWGEGFTEWHNVAGAVPMFSGHYQPKIPTELGFYDLRLDSVREQQATLAKEHGISAFMYYYYWFSGERLLNMPIEKLIASDLDFPFCLMWANENWTRRWDGRSSDILIGQDYEKVPAENFIDDVLEFLRDKRYLRVDGKAVLAVYRPGQMENFPAVVEAWREKARTAGVGELKILAVAVGSNFDALEGSATDNGLDGVLEFPPHNLPWVAGPADRVQLDRRWKGNFMSYQSTAAASIRHAAHMPEDFYPGAMVGFDNTARRQFKPDVWYGSNPYTFHRWVQSLVEAVAHRRPSERVIFINAWNEWAESAILEPTTRHGRTFLLAVRDVVNS